MPSSPPLAAGSSCAAPTPPPGAGGRPAISLPRVSWSYALIESPVLWTGGRGRFFQQGLQLVETARDSARDRARGELERFADRAVALVLREEAVEDLAAVVRHRGHGVVDCHRLVELRQRLVEVARLDLLHGGLTSVRGEAVDARPARHLGEPRAERLVVPQAVEVGVYARENVLENVLGIVLAEAEPLRADRIDVARKALDELVPGGRISLAAAPYELGIRSGQGGHPPTSIRNGEGFRPPRRFRASFVGARTTRT